MKEWKVFKFYWKSGYEEHIEATSASNAMDAIVYTNGFEYVANNLIRFEEDISPFC